MQTTPNSARISATMQFSATFEIQGSGNIYNTKYRLAIGKKHNALKCSLLSIPHKVMIELILWNEDNSQFNENINANSVYKYILNPGFCQHLQHEVNVSCREQTQCAEMQLIEYSTQSNDLAAPFKCRQLYIQRAHQCQCSFQLPLKTKVLAPFTTRSTY